jgi:hypothetical protein
MLTTTPTYSANAAGNIRASAALAASGTATYDLDYSTALAARLIILNTPGGSISATRGLKVELFPRYGASGSLATAPTAQQTYTLPSETASTPENLSLMVETGYWTLKITNLDATNAVTVEITDAIIANLTTT